MSDKFDVKKEVQTVDSLVSHVVPEAGRNPEAFNEHASSLFAEFARLTPEQVQETANAMHQFHGLDFHLGTIIGVASIDRDANGNVTDIKIKQFGGQNNDLDGSIDLNFSKKTVATDTWHPNGMDIKELLKVE